MTRHPLPPTDGPTDGRDDDNLEPLPAGATPNARLQRWIDIIAALLARKRPATFRELASEVPEYWHKLREIDAEPDERVQRTKLETLKRAFERDKDALRELGVPLLSVPDEQGSPGGAYQLRRSDFYLPYLCVAVPGATSSVPRGRDAAGYSAQAPLAFEPDELQAVVDAAACVRSLGDPLLASDAASALRKLAVDLPVDAVAPSPDQPHVVLPRARPDAAVFERVSDALTRRKVVEFDYHAMSTDRTERRSVEPYGLFFLHGHWYLAGRDRDRGALRNFRLNRISRPRVNPDAAQSADYEIPGSFRLRDHARSRHTWELGDGDAVQAVVAFVGASGPTVAASRLGAPVAGAPDRRSFEVRRVDAFVRWLLSFAGEVVPVAPPPLVEAYREAARQTAARYADPAPPPAQAAPVRPPRQRRRDASERGVEAWQPKGAAAQLRRLLHVVPRIADGEEHALREVAEAVGTDVDTLRRDLYALVTRYDAPGGFVEGVQLYVERERVSFVSGQFTRPMRLTVSELCALELGLAVLRPRRAPDEHAVLERARQRLRSVIARLPGDPIPDGLYGASLGEHASTELLATVARSLRERRKLRLVYRKSGSAEPGERVVCPYALVASSGMVYVVAHCDTGGGIRVFRTDRVEAAELLADPFERSPDFSLDDVLRHGAPFASADPQVLRVRYSPRVARWIAEREGRALDPDGGLEVEHPLADPEWGMRHVLQYGAEAEVLEPTALREALRVRLERMAAVS